jgi:hypothetical protein
MQERRRFLCEMMMMNADLLMCPVEFVELRVRETAVQKDAPGRNAKKSLLFVLR